MAGPGEIYDYCFIFFSSKIRLPNQYNDKDFRFQFLSLPIHNWFQTSWIPMYMENREASL